MQLRAVFVFTLLTIGIDLSVSSEDYVIDTSVGFGRTFDGIGAISGGGATSKLLVNYPKQQQSEILDYLFKPNFGASLHIFKVEIGGDIQSTDGTEASHSHYGWDLDFTRGYEWWMLQEAKKRNPDIKLYGLPWGFPGWLRDKTDNPWKNIQTTADYTVNWLKGARDNYNLTIDFLGIWNESPYNATYIKTLRKSLNSAGFSETRIIAPDQNGWDIAGNITQDEELFDAIWGLGCHYPRMQSTEAAQQTGKPLWASEDSVQGGTPYLAQTLNQNYVTGYMTSTVLWNTVVSYYYGLPWIEAGLMSAREPWSGHYDVSLPIWLTAHTTQFTSIGWKYLKHGYGVGNFTFGGSFVSLVSPDEKDFTIIIETLDNQFGVRDVTFLLKGVLGERVKSLYVWYTKPVYGVFAPQYFKQLENLEVNNGMVNIKLSDSEVWTLSTISTGHKGNYPNIPDSTPFPTPYSEDFEGYSVGEEPYYFSQQVGSFEVAEEDSNKFMRQVVIDLPVHWFWCHIDNYNTTLNVFGDYGWGDIEASVSVNINGINSTDSVFLAARVPTAGCRAYNGTGLYFYFSPKQKQFMLTADLMRGIVLASGSVTDVRTDWNDMTIRTKGNMVYCEINSNTVITTMIPIEITNGWVAVGTYPYGYAAFDNFLVNKI